MSQNYRSSGEKFYFILFYLIHDFSSSLSMSFPFSTNASATKNDPKRSRNGGEFKGFKLGMLLL
jgi:hypothetical protein